MTNLTPTDHTNGSQSDPCFLKTTEYPKPGLDTHWANTNPGKSGKYPLLKKEMMASNKVVIPDVLVQLLCYDPELRQVKGELCMIRSRKGGIQSS